MLPARLHGTRPDRQRQSMLTVLTQKLAGSGRRAVCS
jgi:hypothetical protein